MSRLTGSKVSLELNVLNVIHPVKGNKIGDVNAKTIAVVRETSGITINNFQKIKIQVNIS